MRWYVPLSSASIVRRVADNSKKWALIWTIVLRLPVLARLLAGQPLDRLHNRLEAARTALDLALVRRSSAASELASSGLLDPATSLLLADAVRRARQVGPAERDLAETDLTRALRATFGEPGLPQGARGHDGGRRARRRGGGGRPAGLHRPQVLQRPGRRTIYARRRPLARVLRLAGSAPLPEFFDIDDALAATGSTATLEPIGRDPAPRRLAHTMDRHARTRRFYSVHARNASVPAPGPQNTGPRPAPRA